MVKKVTVKKGEIWQFVSSVLQIRGLVLEAEDPSLESDFLLSTFVNWFPTTTTTAPPLLIYYQQCSVLQNKSIWEQTNWETVTI